MSNVAAMSSLKELVHRLRLHPSWISAQFVLTLLLTLLVLAWTRLPDKHVWQVALTLIVPLLLAISVLELEAGTMRALADDDGQREKLVWGACTLLVWVVLFWVAWAVLDWCDNRIPEWAGYLNSRASAGERATVFTYEHIQKWLALAEWVLRWVVVPGKIIPFAMASAQWGLRLPFRKIIRLLLSWRWWLALVLAALVGVTLPGQFFAGLPHGTVSHQIWAVALKLAGSYALAVGCWVLLLGWAAVQMSHQPDPAEDELDQDLFKCLRKSRIWIGAQAGWVLLWVLANLALAFLTGVQSWQVWLSVWLGVPLRIVLLIAMLILQVTTVRSMMGGETKRVRLVWGALSVLVWLVPALGAVALDDLFKSEIVKWTLGNVLAPALLLPFAAASAQWGLPLPWRRVTTVARNWRWWLGVLPASVAAAALPALFLAMTSSGDVQSSAWIEGLKQGIADMVTLGCWILIVGWAAALLTRTVTGSDGA